MSRQLDASALRAILERIDGRGYKAYRDIEGSWAFDGFTLLVAHVQADPFATPSRLQVTIDPAIAALPPSTIRGTARTLGTAALLARSFSEAARRRSARRGTGRSGQIVMEHPGQVVMRQTAVTVHADGAVEARLGVGLPARGRRVAGHEAVQMLLDELPALVRTTLLADAYEGETLEGHAAANEDAEALRESLDAAGLVAFVADEARLPRRSGIDDRPLEPEEVVPFTSPDSLRVSVDLPNAGRITGMGVPEGVTLIVGGGFHGKSTLLRALQDGVYNHRPGDGRELVVTRGDAVKVRAEDGRAVTGVDISPFIDGLPLGKDTTAFTTANASGSTSQAAAISEALEAGAGVLLVDEDTSATNFMIRDRRMQSLVPPEGEPITPFVDRIRELFDALGVSCVLVLGGSGDYLDVADRVVRMSDYRPVDVSERARAVARELPTGRSNESGRPLTRPEPRTVDRTSLDASRGRRARSVKVPDDRTLLLGEETVDLAAVEQLVARAQARAIGHALAWVAEQSGSAMTTAELLDTVEATLDERGFDTLTPWPLGDLAAFRRFELAAALNRVRALRVE